MQARHVPDINLRYWFGIIFASIFGTNLGDLYAHESGLGLLILCALFSADYVLERKDGGAHELYYWLAIIIIRTGATNIADFLAYRVRIPSVLLVCGLAAIMAVFAWRGSVSRARAERLAASPALGGTNLAYWGAMLAAGVFGTVGGDICSHRFGQGPASLGLGLMFAILLAVVKPRAASGVAVYWCAVALARTAGTSMGDWFAENKILHLGLPLSTLLTGFAFVGLLTLWRSTPKDARAAA